LITYLRAVCRAAPAALLVVLVTPFAARAIPSSGPHETVDIWSTTKTPGTAAGIGYSGRYHAVGDPHADPPALRRLVIQLPPGTRIDTAVPGRCTASDMEIMLQGEPACPPNARVGKGEATVRQFGLGVSTYPTVLYNAKDDLLELIKSGDRVVGVVHTYVRGTTLDGPVPTCIGGGQPPASCPFDQLTLLSNSLQTVRLSVGHGAARRNYGTTPPVCPASRRWVTPVTLYYADGSVDRVTPRAPCTKPKQHRKKRHSRRRSSSTRAFRPTTG
jgi:hypothetical protein